MISLFACSVKRTSLPMPELALCTITNGGREILIWDFTGNADSAVFRTPIESLGSPRTTSDGKHMYGVSSKGLDVYRLADFSLQSRWKLSQFSEIKGVAASTDGQIAVIGARDVETGEEGLYFLGHDAQPLCLSKTEVDTPVRGSIDSLGRKFAVAHGRSVVVMEIDSSATVTVATGGAPAFSPFSSHLAYIDETSALTILNLETGSRRKLAAGSYAGWPRWSPDGAFLAVSLLNERLFGRVGRSLNFGAATYAIVIYRVSDGVEMSRIGMDKEGSGEPYDWIDQTIVQR